LTVSVHAHWLSGPRAPRQAVIDYLFPIDTGEYNDADIAYIAARYWETGTAVGIDPLLTVAQMILETAHLTSFWSQRPRRNPAGIGVTGEAGAGVSFPNWRDSARAHVGRILAYALPWGAGTTAQNALIAEALGWRDLPDDHRGVGADVETLGRFWADDPQYAVKLVGVASRFA
jgi:hypothetical protein